MSTGRSIRQEKARRTTWLMFLRTGLIGLSTACFDVPKTLKAETDEMNKGIEITRFMFAGRFLWRECTTNSRFSVLEATKSARLPGYPTYCNLKRQHHEQQHRRVSSARNRFYIVHYLFRVESSSTVASPATAIFSSTHVCQLIVFESKTTDEIVSESATETFVPAKRVLAINLTVNNTVQAILALMTGSSTSSRTLLPYSGVQYLYST